MAEFQNVLDLRQHVPHPCHSFPGQTRRVQTVAHSTTGGPKENWLIGKSDSSTSIPSICSQKYIMLYAMSQFLNSCFQRMWPWQVLRVHVQLFREVQHLPGSWKCHQPDPCRLGTGWESDICQRPREGPGPGVRPDQARTGGAENGFRLQSWVRIPVSHRQLVFRKRGWRFPTLKCGWEVQTNKRLHYAFY